MMEKPGGDKENPAPLPNQVEQTEETLKWTCHPVKRRPLVSALVTVFILAVIVIVYYTTMSGALAGLALVVMFASLAKFYFPTTYRLSRDKITVKTMTQTLHKEWSMYRSCYPDKNGILLSPFARPSRLENFRGIYLMFADNNDEVTCFVRAHIGKKTGSDSQEESSKV